jgi:hypothetical protein
VHLETEETTAFGRFHQISAPDTLLTALSRDAGDVLLRAMQDWTRLLRARDPPGFTAALQARIFGDSHLSVLCDQLPVNTATCV